MTQTELAMLMNSLARSNAQFDPVVSIAFLAEFLEHTQFTLDMSD